MCCLRGNDVFVPSRERCQTYGCQKTDLSLSADRTQTERRWVMQTHQLAAVLLPLAWAWFLVKVVAGGDRRPPPRASSRRYWPDSHRSRQTYSIMHIISSAMARVYSRVTVWSTVRNIFLSILRLMLCAQVIGRFAAPFFGFIFSLLSNESLCVSQPRQDWCSSTRLHAVMEILICIKWEMRTCSAFWSMSEISFCSH